MINNPYIYICAYVYTYKIHASYLICVAIFVRLYVYTYETHTSQLIYVATKIIDDAWVLMVLVY